MSDTSDLTKRALYRYWIDEHVRFNDLDALGHVNNNMFGVYFESGRVGFMTGIGIRNGPSDPAVVIVHLEIDFLAELHYPAKIQVGLSVLKIGTASVTLVAGLFLNDVCHATSKAIMVRLDRETRRATPLTQEERDLLTRYEITHV